MKTVFWESLVVNVTVVEQYVKECKIIYQNKIYNISNLDFTTRSQENMVKIYNIKETLLPTH